MLDGKNNTFLNKTEVQSNDFSILCECIYNAVFIFDKILKGIRCSERNISTLKRKKLKKKTFYGIY